MQMLHRTLQRGTRTYDAVSPLRQGRDDKTSDPDVLKYDNAENKMQGQRQTAGSVPGVERRTCSYSSASGAQGEDRGGGASQPTSPATAPRLPAHGAAPGPCARCGHRAGSCGCGQAFAAEAPPSGYVGADEGAREEAGYRETCRKGIALVRRGRGTGPKDPEIGTEQNHENNNSACTTRTAS